VCVCGEKKKGKRKKKKDGKVLASTYVHFWSL